MIRLVMWLIKWLVVYYYMSFSVLLLLCLFWTWKPSRVRRFCADSSNKRGKPNSLEHALHCCNYYVGGRDRCTFVPLFLNERD